MMKERENSTVSGIPRSRCMARERRNDEGEKIFVTVGIPRSRLIYRDAKFSNKGWAVVLGNNEVSGCVEVGETARASGFASWLLGM